jgi:hypothetical protein
VAVGVPDGDAKKLRDEVADDVWEGVRLEDRLRERVVDPERVKLVESVALGVADTVEDSEALAVALADAEALEVGLAVGD